ncbi:MAG: hypothetical protein ABIP55_13760, partial [Tepidisphaeraceae bacterium]
YEDGKPIADKPLNALQLAWFMMESLNHGYVAAVVWTMEDAWYDRLMPYGVIGRAKDGWPLKPSYHMLRLFTHTIPTGWRAMRVSGTSEQVIVSAARGAREEELTVLVLNRSEKPARVTISGVGAGGGVGRSLTETIWNGRGDGAITRGAKVQVDAKEIVRVTLRAMTLTALTSAAPRMDGADEAQ